MILELLFNLIFGLVNLLIAVIPTIELPSGFLSGIGEASYFINLVSYFLPMGSIISCITIIFLLDNIKLVVSIFNFIIRKIPSIS